MCSKFTLDDWERREKRRSADTHSLSIWEKWYILCENTFRKPITMCSEYAKSSLYFKKKKGKENLKWNKYLWEINSSNSGASVTQAPFQNFKLL